MIRLLKDFSSECVDSYYREMFSIFKEKYKDNLMYQKVKLKEDDFEFEFLKNTQNKYSISFKKLLTGSREEILNVEGMQLYMDICRLRVCCSKTMAEFMEKLYRSFPNEIDYKVDDGIEIYEILPTSQCVRICNSSRCSVDNKNVIIQFITEKIKKYDIYFHDHYQALARKEYLKNRKKRKKRNFQCGNITFDELILYLKIMYEDNCQLLLVQFKSNNVQYFIDYDDMKPVIRHQLIDSLGIKTCPYCNAQYITSWIDKSGSKHTTADLDHFYQKAYFPLFALSLFNFIPSCHICNSLMKNQRYMETIYPKSNCFGDDAKFKIIPKGTDSIENIVDIWLGKGRHSLKDIHKKYALNLINMSSNEYKWKLIDNSIELFNLNKIYKNHLDEAINVYLLIRIYLDSDNSYKNYMGKICDRIGLNKSYSHSLSKEEITYFLLGFVIDGQNELDKPLAKLISDIYNSEMNNGEDD
ncbi:MAG: hypothetical protein IKL31_02265 [Ruminococcus sp.]|nr:hypothetical protein [Ruminococcus sp.]